MTTRRELKLSVLRQGGRHRECPLEDRSDKREKKTIGIGMEIAGVLPTARRWLLGSVLF